MKIETKYNIGDVVYLAYKYRLLEYIVESVNIIKSKREDQVKYKLKLTEDKINIGIKPFFVHIDIESKEEDIFRSREEGREFIIKELEALKENLVI